LAETDDWCPRGRRDSQAAKAEVDRSKAGEREGTGEEREKGLFDDRDVAVFVGARADS
jgi:hypothetical protein